jgi:hypothetical protein
MEYDGFSMHILRVARKIDVTVHLNQMWAISNILQARTDIKSLTVRFHSDAKQSVHVQRVLAIAQSSRKIPVRNKAKLVWITGSTKKVVDCDELSEIEPGDA